MGIDLGTDNSVVALARKRGVDIISNEASQRSTPSIVSFGHDQRYVGEAGMSQRMMNLKNTVAEPKRLLARQFSDPAFLEELKNESYEVVEGDNGEIAVKVNLCGSSRTFRPVQVIAMLLANLKKIAEADHGAEVVDVAVSVPAFFTEHHRRAIRAAAQIAGLTCLRIINDNTATALAYGITKTDLPEKDPRHIAFVDCGRDCMQVSIVAYTKGELKVLSHAHSKKVGGRYIDEMLFQHFAEEFLSKFKIDARSQDRARLRLQLQCEKLKKTLSACPADLDTPINVECLMNDMDVSGMMNRLQLEDLFEKNRIFDEIESTCEQALTLAGLNKEQLASVELVGGTSRIPALRARIGAFFGKDCQTTVNAAESVARGASLACAMDSPAFKVREFKVIDWNVYPMDVSYAAEDGTGAGSVSLKQGAAVPGSESIKLEVASPVSLEWAYSEDANLALDVPRKLGSHVLKISPKKGKQTVLATVGLDTSSCISADATVESQVEVEVAPPKVKAKAPKAAAKAGTQEQEGGANHAKDADAKMGDGADEHADGEGKAGGAEAAAPKEDPAPAKKVVTRREKVDARDVSGEGYTADALEKLKTDEFEMALQDRIVQETNDAKNKLEEYVYNMRDALSSRLSAYEKEEVRVSFGKELDAMEEWLYGDGETANKGVFMQKLEALQAVGEPIAARAREFDLLPDALARLEKALGANSQLLETNEPEYAHISPEERAGAAEECANAREWAQQHKEAVASASKLAMPPVTVQQVDDKVAALTRLCQTTMSKPKPAPPPPPPKSQQGKDDAAGHDGADNGGEAQEGAGAAEDVPMEGAEADEKGEAVMEENEGDGGNAAAEPCEMDNMD